MSTVFFYKSGSVARVWAAFRERSYEEGPTDVGGALEGTTFFAFMQIYGEKGAIFWCKVYGVKVGRELFSVMTYTNKMSYFANFRMLNRLILQFFRMSNRLILQLL